jgi:Mor family transcriptional regulator
MSEPLFSNDSNKLDPAKVLAHMTDPAVLTRWEGTLKEMVEIAEAKLRSELGDVANVPSLARHVVFALCDTLGGSVVYLPRGDTLKRAMRDAAIFRDWRDGGKPPADLVRKYRLANQTIYDIIARQRALHRKREPDLFGTGNNSVH